jgi:DNA (cytosine-5)-methyltransferase 1
VAKRYLKMKDGQYNPVSGNMSFEIFKFLDPQSISITLVSSDAHKLGVRHKDQMRRLTPRECARLQGYPDDFNCHPIDAHAYRQFGNSVSVPVIHAVIADLFKNNKIAKRVESNFHSNPVMENPFQLVSLQA